MNRRLLAILFISLLATTQYGRSLSYIGCLLENQLETSGTRCDCEQILTDDGPRQETDMPSTASHQHLNFDDYCTGQWLLFKQDIQPVSTRFPDTSTGIVSLTHPVAPKPPEQV